MIANPKATEKQGYHKFKGHGPLVDKGWGSFEVFWSEGHHAPNPGWYWWACFPGCLPDGDPSGPFDTSSAAYADAQGGA